jgi:sensor domain DACNV-containing protein
MIVVINQDLVAQVRHAWIADQQHPQRGRRARPLPDSERLGILLDTVFRASMLADDGAAPRASVAWLSQSDFQDHELKHARHSELMLRLERARPLAPTLIAELGRTTESGSASLLVDWAGGAPMVWGILYYQRAARTLDELPGAIEEGVHGAPDCPILSIEGVGSIRVARGEAVVGRITRGEFARAVPTPFYAHAMGLILYELFGLRMALKANRYVDDGDNTYGHGLLECLRYLLEHLDSRASGALMVFVPQASMQDALQHAELGWAATGSLELRRLLSARIRHEKAVKERQWLSASCVTKAQALMRSRLDSLARLGSLDGALLLSPDFELIGFGARLRAPEWSGTVMEGPDGFGGGGRPFDAARLDARLAAAVAYVGAVPGAVAFVASADGPIRALARKGFGPIQCWPDCRPSMAAS